HPPDQRGQADAGCRRVKRSGIALLSLASVVLAASAPAGSQALATGRCPEPAQTAFGGTAADVARRCGVNAEALDRSNPGLGLGGRKSQLGITVTVPRPPLPSPAIGAMRHGFVPVPTPPGALGR